MCVSLFLLLCSVAEPHEICDEENFANVVWKETPSGDTAAVRCPPNAVGKTLPVRDHRTVHTKAEYVTQHHGA